MPAKTFKQKLAQNKFEEVFYRTSSSCSLNVEYANKEVYASMRRYIILETFDLMPQASA
jgi:hypothetical protein